MYIYKTKWSKLFYCSNMRIILILMSLILVSCTETPQQSIETTGSKSHDSVNTTSVSEINTRQHQKEDILAIKKVMAEQQTAWSKHDLEGFMQGYWISDSLKFYGQSGLTKGWHQTLANYKKSYPSAKDTGTLTFDLLDISQITPGAYWVMGRYSLERKVGDANGSFIVIFKKIDGRWKIVADMSASD